MSTLLSIIGAPFYREAFGLVLCCFALGMLLARGMRRTSPGMLATIAGLLCLGGSFALGSLGLFLEVPALAVLDPGHRAHEGLKLGLRFYAGLPLFIAGAVAELTSSRRALFSLRTAALEEKLPAREKPRDAGAFADRLALVNRDLDVARAELGRIDGERSRAGEKLRETMDLLARSEERFRTVFEKTNDGIALVAADSGRISLVNPGFTNLTGRTAAEMQKMTLGDIVGREIGQRDAEGFRELSRQGRLSPATILRKGGEPIRVELSFAMAEVAGKPLVLCIARDVSEWQRLKDALEAKNHTLEEGERRLEDVNREVLDRAEKMREMNEKLRELQRVKDHFLSSVSHELRTPLTSIRSFSEILLEHDDADQEVRREFLAIIKKESERLTRLINDVLDLARIEAGAVKLRIGRVDLEGVVADVVRSLAPLARERELSIERALPADLPRMEADRDKVQQVLTNLVSNSIRFGRASTKITISAAHGESGFLVVSVSDHGPGVAPEHAEAIFDKFRKSSDGSDRHGENSGLGLAICREIVTLHGGRIWVESRPGAGAKFCFTVKAHQGAAPREAVAADIALPPRRSARADLPPLRLVGAGGSSLPPLGG